MFKKLIGSLLICEPVGVILLLNRMIIEQLIPFSRPQVKKQTKMRKMKSPIGSSLDISVGLKYTGVDRKLVAGVNWFLF